MPKSSYTGNSAAAEEYLHLPSFKSMAKKAWGKIPKITVELPKTSETMRRKEIKAERKAEKFRKKARKYRSLAKELEIDNDMKTVEKEELKTVEKVTNEEPGIRIAGNAENNGLRVIKAYFVKDANGVIDKKHPLTNANDAKFYAGGWDYEPISSVYRGNKFIRIATLEEASTGIVAEGSN